VGREPLAIEGAEKKMASYQQDLYEKKDYQIGMQADSLLRGESNIPVFEQKRNEGSLGLIRDGTFSDGKRRESGIYDVSENNSGSSEQSRKYQPVV
jgi:hypothetical protein